MFSWRVQGSGIRQREALHSALGGQGHPNPECTAVIRVRPAFNLRITAVDHGNVFDDGEAKTGAARITATGSINPVETLKQAFAMNFWDARTVVGDGDDGVAPLGRGGNGDPRIRRSVLNGVGDQIGHGMRQKSSASKYPEGWVDRDIDREAFFSGSGRDLFNRFRNDPGDTDGRAGDIAAG
jgi:hypothetical protein